jgi:hypothetical protein
VYRAVAVAPLPSAGAMVRRMAGIGPLARTRWRLAGRARLSRRLAPLLPAAGLLAAGVLAGSPAPAAPAIVQASLLDLSVLEVLVVVAGVEGSDEVSCLVRDGDGRERVAARERVASGTMAGPQAVLSLLLPILDPGEREFAISLRRGDLALARTGWRPLAAP